MAKVFCRSCARQLHDWAHTCPQFCAPQFAKSANPHHAGQSPGLGSTSLILGIVSICQKKTSNGLAIAGMSRLCHFGLSAS